MKELEYPFDAELIRKKRIKLRKALLADESAKFVETRIAVLGGSTTSEIKNMLELFLLNFGIKPSFYESEYNKYYEDGMFDNPELAAFKPDIVYIHTSNRNITRWPAVSDRADEVDALLQGDAEKFRGLWDHLFQAYHCSIIQNNFELPFYRVYGNQDPVMLQGKSAYVNRLNEIIYAYAREHESFYVHDIHYESAAYGLDAWSDPYYWHMYKYAVAVPAIPYTAYGVAGSSAMTAPSISRSDRRPRSGRPTVSFSPISRSRRTSAFCSPSFPRTTTIRRAQASAGRIRF